MQRCRFGSGRHSNRRRWSGCRCRWDATVGESRTHQLVLDRQELLHGGEMPLENSGLSGNNRRGAHGGGTCEGNGCLTRVVCSGCRSMTVALSGMSVYRVYGRKRHRRGSRDRGNGRLWARGKSEIRGQGERLDPQFEPCFGPADWFRIDWTRIPPAVQMLQPQWNSMREQHGQRVVQLQDSRAMLDVGSHGQVAFAAQHVVDKALEIATRTHFQEHPRAVLIHPVDGFPEAHGYVPAAGRRLSDLIGSV